MLVECVRVVDGCTYRDETRRDETRRDETRRDETRRDETRRDAPTVYVCDTEINKILPFFFVFVCVLSSRL